MSLSDNTTELQEILDAVNALPEAGGTITVDAELSDTSTNPVQNKVIKAALDNLGSASESSTDEEFITMLAEEGMLPAIMVEGAILTDTNGDILLM